MESLEEEMSDQSVCGRVPSACSSALLAEDTHLGEDEDYEEDGTEGRLRGEGRGRGMGRGMGHGVMPTFAKLELELWVAFSAGCEL